MDEEIEDLVGDVKCTESQKSVATSNVYSLDFTDSSSGKNNSSGKETYVIECNDSDDSEKYIIHDSRSVINLRHNFPIPELMHRDVQCEPMNDTSLSKKYHQCSKIAQESFTQTSKTILELAHNEGALIKSTDNKTLQTQTSFISITENKTVQYQFEVSGAPNDFNTNDYNDKQVTSKYYSVTYNQVLTSTLEDASSKFPVSENECERSEDAKSVNSSNGQIIKIVDDNSKEDILSPEDQSLNHQDQYENTSDFGMTSPYDSDIEEDSLMAVHHQVKLNIDCKLERQDSISDVSEVPISIDNEVAELYDKISDSMEIFRERSPNISIRRLNTLTPLTEESIVKKQSLIDITPSSKAMDNSNTNETEEDVLFTNNSGIRIKILPNDDMYDKKKGIMKLPPIPSNHSCLSSPHVNLLLSLNSNIPLIKSGAVCFYEGDNDRFLDRWEIRTKNLASGESPMISRRNDMTQRVQTVQLPPINIDSRAISNQQYRNESFNSSKAAKTDTTSVESSKRPININEKIKELKMCYKTHKVSARPRYTSMSDIEYSSEEHQAAVATPPVFEKKTTKRPLVASTSTVRSKKKTLAGRHGSDTRSAASTSTRTTENGSRSVSPASDSSPCEGRLCDAAESGCEALCAELLRRLRSSSWSEVTETLKELPDVLNKFWSVISENRIADLLRQVTAHVESPRTQVARAACNTLAAILKNTNYTKKPDFYEAMTMLLIKTSSFSRPVRRAANVALDDVVSGVDCSHAVTALCIHGVGHKSPLVRCAAARLLVVSAALAGGGRELLRARPPTAAAARRHALTALAALLEDKDTDTRKYAERLYSMLRPLVNFEAYYLTDVDVEVASRQMKKYDKLLLCGPPRESR